MENPWFNDFGNLKISAEEFYCNMIYPWNKDGEYEIKKEIEDFVDGNYMDYKSSSDIVAIHYAIEYASATKTNYSACTLLCRSGVTANPDWDMLEERHSK
mgnify:CR=1 FL=1